MAWAWAHSVGVCGEAISEQGSPRHNHDGALSSSRGDEPCSRECALDSGACLPTGTSSAVVLTERELWEQTHQRIFFRFRACVAGGPALPFFIHTSARLACPLPRGSGGIYGHGHMYGHTRYTYIVSRGDASMHHTECTAALQLLQLAR